MNDQLLQIRQQLASALRSVDDLIAKAPTSDGDTEPSEYRVSPGGALSDKGVEEIYRRFNNGEPDAVIARAMSVSVQGVQKRRTLWRKVRLD